MESYVHTVWVNRLCQTNLTSAFDKFNLLETLLKINK